MTTTHSAELNGGIWTSWLPVTTSWTSQSACNSVAWARYGIQPSESFWPYIYDPAYGQSVANTLTCLPPEATQWWDGDSTVSNTITRWSIGPIVCPAAYATVSTSIISDISTSIICCPSNFNFVRNLPENGGIDGICTSTMTSGQSLTYASPASNSYAVATTAFTDSALLIAVPVEGYNFAASTTSSSTSAPSTTASLKSNTAGAGPPTNTSAQTSGLTGGAKAGIGVGVAGVVLIVSAVVAALFFLRRRRRYALAASELPSGGENKRGTLVEADSEPERSEIDGSSRPVELQG